MASPYFAGPKPGAKTNPLQSPSAGALTKSALIAAPPETKVVNVRAHTRVVPIKPPPDVNTATVRPAQVSTALRFKPHYAGEPVAGHTGAERAGIFGRPANAVIPYYTDAYTTAHGQGPAGQPSTQLNAADVAASKRIQAENYGTPGVIIRSLLPGGLNEGGINASNAVSRIANVTSMGLPGGGVGEAAGLFGFGLKALRGGRAVKDVAEVAPKVAEVAVSTPKAVTPIIGTPLAPKAGARDKAAILADPKSWTERNVGRFLTPEAAKELDAVTHVNVEGTLATPRSSGGAPPNPPRPPTVAAAVPAVPPTPSAVVRGALPGAKSLRGKQEAGYSVERAKRAAAASVHLENQSLTPTERITLAKSELRGELPKIDFQGFKELNDQSLQALQTHVLNHPNLMPFQKIRTSDALVNALAGKVPTRSEIVLLEHVFGKNTAASLGAIAKIGYRDKLLSVLNIPRSLMASFDLSAPFRQGLMVSTRHPEIFFHNFGTMVKAFGSENVYHAALDEIRARPTYPLMIEAKLPITELASDVGAREEQFASDYAEKLTGGKYGPVRASGRAYTGFLDKTRADVFDHLIRSAEAQGINVQDPKFLKSLGSYVGSATGRGDLGKFQEAGKVLNTFFFSPRLLASRMNFLNPAYYARLDPFARKEALRSALQLAGTMSVILGLASKIAGVHVQTDPRNPDWGKIRVGNTRFDIAGGFQQELRLLAQLATGVAISSTSGKKLSLTAGGFGKPTRLDILQRFFMGKESPIASLTTDWLRGSNQIGAKFGWTPEITQRMVPLLAQDSYDLYNEKQGGVNGLEAAFAGYGIGSVGIGMQTYAPQAPKASVSSPADYFGGAGSGGGSPYFAPSGSGGGGYFGR